MKRVRHRRLEEAKLESEKLKRVADYIIEGLASRVVQRLSEAFNR